MEHKKQAQQSLRLCGVPKNLNLNVFNLGSALTPGPASDSSWQSNLEPKQCRLGKHRRCEQGQTQCGQDTMSTHQWYLFAVFLPPHITTEQVSLNKIKKIVSSTVPFVSEREPDTEETSKQKKL